LCGLTATQYTPCFPPWLKEETPMTDRPQPDDARTSRGWLWIVLLIPYAALLWLPFYNDSHPSFAGFPFFYWYQFLWVPLTSLLLYVVYRSAK
jgi:hypothetical protein